MKKGQLYIVLTNKARAIITKAGPSMVELRWTHKPDGTPSNPRKKPITYTREELEAGVNTGDIKIGNPDGDPNLMFLMKKRN